MGVGAKHSKFIVLIGPDCSGKSTLAAMLSEHYGIPLTKGLRIADRTAMTLSISHTLHKRIAGVDKDPVLMDRWQFPDDIIYERVHGRAESPFVEMLHELASMSWDAGVLFLHVSALPNVLTARLKARGDEDVDGTQIIKARMEYLELFSQVNLPIVHIDTSIKTPEETFHRAVELIDTFYSGRYTE